MWHCAAKILSKEVPTKKPCLPGGLTIAHIQIKLEEVIENKEGYRKNI